MPLERIKFGEKEILLLGTAHISQSSIDEVKGAIEKEKPDVVGVELDAKRFAQLRQGDKWQDTNIGHIISSGQTYLFLLTIMLSNFQRSLGQQLGVKPGTEMIEAMKVAEEKSIPVALLDRDVNVTLKRAVQKMTLREKVHFATSTFAGFFSEEKKAITYQLVEELKDKDILNRLLQQLGKEMPSVKKVLVDERDHFIAHSISKAPGKKILAVVGAGHVEGIKAAIGKEIDITSISVVDNGTDWMKAVQWAIPVVFAVIIIAIFLTKGAVITLNAVVLWFLTTGLLAGLGTLIAGGHPMSIITALLAAPFTTLHPLLAAGWVAGAVEAKVRNPKVKDFEQLRNLNSISEFRDNQVTRILLVVALANLGAMLGVIVGFPLVASLLG